MTVPLRVLILEDRPDDAELMVRQLREHGFDVRATRVETQSDFLAALETSPDVILADYNLPQWNALEAIRRSQFRLPDVPVIIVTGSIGEETAVWCLQQGAVDYLLKDRLARLGDAVDRALEERRLKEERRRAEAALRQSEEKYRLFFEEDLAGHFISKPDGRILACNPAFARTFGFASVEEALSTSAASLYAEPGDRMKFLDLIRSEKRLERHEKELRRKDGKTLYVIENVLGTFDRRGELTEIHGFLLDATEQRRAEEELRQAQKMEAVGRLAGGVAHDFNNILTVILGHLELLEPTLEPTDPRLEEMEEIRKAAERAAGLTRQLLAFSRKQVLQPTILDLNAVLKDVENMLQRLIGEDIQIRTAFAPSLGPVQADPGQIEQMIMNLAVNARDAMPRGGTLVIETANVDPESTPAALSHLESPAPHVMVSVADTGCGMNATTMAHLFEPFFTTKEPGKGTGLGLATVYGMVKQSGGFIKVESEPGRGSTFRIFFPRAAEESPHPGVLRTGDQTPTGSEAILLVEDDEALRALTLKILGQASYKVLAASGPKEALDLASGRGGAIDLLLTDVVMPGMSGPDLARRIRTLRPGLAVLFMSGYTDESIGPYGVLKPGIHFIQKPFTQSGLLLKVREALSVETPAEV
ncbi:MAG: response regulator [Thermoanaerobaculia bacterium]